MQYNLEHRLKQKLMLFENAVARLASMKAELRANSDQVRRDLSQSIQHQIGCLKAREQEILGQLEDIIAEKEEDFSAQQDVLSKAIGACQNSLECLKENNVSTNTIHATLIRLNALNIKPHGNPNVSFEADPTACRLATSSFGELCSEPHQQLESLPMDMEMYEDDLHIHKSVMMPRTNPIICNATKETSVASEDSVSSSFEVVQNNHDDNMEAIKENPIAFYQKHINNITKSNNQDWLGKSNSATTPYQSLSQHQNRPMSAQENQYEFMDVIHQIQQSSKNKWLIQPSVKDISKMTDRLSLSTPTISNEDTMKWLNNSNNLKWINNSMNLNCTNNDNWLPKIGEKPTKTYTDPALWLANN